jgi:PAS domain S-box-containing protein
MTGNGTSQNEIPPEASIPTAPLGSIPCIEELQRRPSRPRDYEKESRACVKLVSALARSPSTILQTLAEAIQEIIHDRKLAREALRASENNFRQIVDSIPGLVCIMDANGQIEQLNQPLLKYFGKNPELLKGWQLTDAVHPDDLPGVTKAYTFSVTTGTPYEIQHRCRRADGIYRWFQVRGLAVRDVDGQIRGWYILLTDIDDRKRAEEALRQVQGDLARINRVTTMGELAASLAHEIKQPISGAITNANVCLRKLDHDEPNLDEVRTVVTRIRRDVQRAAEIIDRIRAQFEKGALRQQTLDVNEIVPETVTLLRDEAVRHSILVRMELAADLPQIVGDRLQLQQVMMNLILNSIEAMKNVDGIREIIIQSQRAEKGQVLVSLSDTGTGLPPQSGEQIFSPFFTTKSHGTGMGLRISRSIIESHGGRLWADSPSGHGATFRFTLPAVTENQRSIQPMS